MLRLLFVILAGLASFSGCSSSAHTSGEWPSDTSSPPIPQALGVNIHFTDPQSGEMKMLAAAGFSWVRMDFVWQQTEAEKGKYDFAPYDRLLTELDKHQIRPLFILDYANKLYDSGRAPYTDEGRRAFAKWSAAAVRHYRGRGILWEIYNEPNTGFWTPKPKVDDYIKLALAASKEIHAAAPGEQIIGPAIWGMDFEFLEACFQGGLLDYWSAVSVHPYRKTEPETVVADYARLRQLIEKYAPGKRVPIVSSEWGYSSASFNVGEDKQAALLSRQLLINQSQGIVLSIWYDWHDDGQTPSEIEHHFGTVLAPYDGVRNPVYAPKPAYRASQAFSTILGGYRFADRAVSSHDVYLLRFRNGSDTKIAAWTTSWFDQTVTIPVGPGTYRVLSYTGQTLAFKTATQAGLELKLNSTPQYILPEKT